eukprot:gene7961-12427_t
MFFAQQNFDEDDQFDEDYDDERFDFFDRRETAVYNPKNSAKPFQFENSKLYCHNPPNYLEFTKQKIDLCLKKDLPKDFFVCHGKMELPLIKINDDYLLKYPCDKQMCETLIKDSDQAPFGRGEETIVDTTIRNSWQVNKKIEFLSSELDNSTSENNSILKDIQAKLSPGCSLIRSEFYKMLVYEKGSHFKRHKDTIRGFNHFGTLIIFLPTFYEGGEFQVRHLDEEEEYQFSLDEKKFNLSHCDWVAFFTDCEHEIKEIKKGYRVALTFQLYYEGANAPSLVGTEKMNVINEIQYHHDSILDLIEGNPIGLMLSHQYSEKTLKSDSLKGKDATYFQLFSRNQKYKVQLIQVEIDITTNEYEDEDFYKLTLKDFDSKVFFLNDWKEVKLIRRNYRENETGNEGTEISYQYLHGAIIISRNEEVEKSSKKTRIDVDSFIQKIDILFTPSSSESQMESQQLGSQDDFLVVENNSSESEPLLEIPQLMNELYSIIRESSNNVHVIFYVLKKVSTKKPNSELLNFISFVSFLLMGFLFKTKEKLNNDEIKKLKEIHKFSLKYNHKKKKQKTPTKSTIYRENIHREEIEFSNELFYFKDCIKLSSIDDFNTKEIIEISDGNFEIDADESIDLIKMRIVQAFKMNKFKDYKNLSHYLVKEIIAKEVNTNEIFQHAKFLIPYSEEKSIILFFRIFKEQATNPSFKDHFFKLIFSLNKNREDYVGTLFNLCIENLSVYIANNYYPKKQKEACEVLLTLADEKIGFLSFSLFVNLFKYASIYPNKLPEVIQNLLNEKQNYLVYNFCVLNPNMLSKKSLALFLKSADKYQLKKIYDNMLPKMIKEYNRGNLWANIHSLSPTIKKIFFDPVEYKDVSIDYIYHLLESNPTFYNATKNITDIIDDFFENDNVEKIFENLEKVNNPSLSLYFIEKIENNPKFKQLILKHLTFIFSNFQATPKTFGDNCAMCKKVHHFLYNSSNKTLSIKKNGHHINQHVATFRYSKILNLAAGFSNASLVRNQNENENVQSILSKLRKIQNKLLGNGITKPIEIVENEKTTSKNSKIVIEID